MRTPATPLIPPLSPRSLLFLAVALFAVAAASILGSSATAPALPVWYPALRKPWFNPPNWAFPVAWTSLFALMAYGFWRILRQTDAGPARGQAIAAFVLQLIVNVSWSFAFFGAKSVASGLIVSVLLVLAVAWNILSYWKLDEFAAVLQLPYLGWVSFALVLNAAIWHLN